MKKRIYELAIELDWKLDAFLDAMKSVDVEFVNYLSALSREDAQRVREQLGEPSTEQRRETGVVSARVAPGSMLLTAHPYRQDTGPHFGYWGDKDSDLPHPSDFVDTSWDAQERQLVCAFLQQGVTKYHWRRSPFPCRLCKARVGPKCMSDGVYTWPERFLHYVEVHGVKPPQEFIDHVLEWVTVAGMAVQLLADQENQKESHD